MQVPPLTAENDTAEEGGSSHRPIFDATRKEFRRGTHRTMSPGETFARAREHFGPIGITRVVNVTGLDCIGIPVVMATRPNARSLAVSQGKGVDLDAARASAVMESIELFHAERITQPLKLATFNELRFACELASIDGLPAVSATAFHPDRTLLWIGGTDLMSARARWLPFELVHTNYTLPFPSGSGCFVMSSNGLASGNHPLEAISHALCEVIERDANALFRLLPTDAQDRLRLDTRTVDDDECRAVLRLYDRADVAVAVWDMTSDIGVAAFRCVIIDRGQNPFRPLGPVEGMGCHPSREVALLRSLTEAAQARLTLIAGSRDDNGRSRYRDSQRSEVMDRARERLIGLGVRALVETPTHTARTFEEDISWILNRLAGAGITEAIAVDLTKPEFGFPVVRVVVPGLETYHHAQGYVMGRRAQRRLASVAKVDA